MVRVVTDSSADIPAGVAGELGISIIPLYLRFGEEVLRDGVDITADAFYDRLARSRTPPQTSTPSPGDFAMLYKQLAEEGADGILSLHLSPRYSGALNAANLAKEYAPAGCPVTVMDSMSVSMGCGLVAMAAARAARQGAGLAEVTAAAARAIRRTHIIGMIADIHYLMRGRRLSLPGAHRLLGRLGTALHFKLLGELYEAGRVRGRGMAFREAKAQDKLVACLTRFPHIEELAVLYARKPSWAEHFSARVASLLPEQRLYHGRLSGATGLHGGPRAMAVAFIEAEATEKL